MAPRKRKLASNYDQNELVSLSANDRKRLTKVDKERNICKKRLGTIEQGESFSTDDRFTQAERKSLLEAYDKFGFQVFQDMQLLQTFLTNRTENDLKGLLNRLRVRLQEETNSEDKTDHLSDWQRLCQSLMGSFAKDKKVNLDDAISDALMLAASEFHYLEPQDIAEPNRRPDNRELLNSFGQLLMGKFPDNMTPANARISMKLFDHINDLVDGMSVIGIEDGAWLEDSTKERRARQEMALQGLKELDSCMKKCPTLKDIERSRNIEALSLELPKIKRITELLNPLDINESLVNGLIE